ncbi:hypothetical protein J1614_007210 [Plenodomus biglobosus]|nr:hypothetical protein J1614_007210 [Plenodomus biglobosus]
MQPYHFTPYVANTMQSRIVPGSRDGSRSRSETPIWHVVDWCCTRSAHHGVALARYSGSADVTTLDALG